MRKRSERIRCSPVFKNLLDNLQKTNKKRMTYPKATDELAEFMLEDGFEKRLKRHLRRKKR